MISFQIQKGKDGWRYSSAIPTDDFRWLFTGMSSEEIRSITNFEKVLEDDDRSFVALSFLEKKRLFLRYHEKRIAENG